MGRRWREFVESVLPWFDPAKERVRNARTERIRQRSITARIRSERVIDEYERADAAAQARATSQARRDDDQ